MTDKELLQQTVVRDALTVSFMRLAGLDKPQARLCADIALQCLADISQPKP